MNKKEMAALTTKKSILKVARQKFASKGFDSTSLEEIVEELHLTRGAFYHHFKNKKVLFLALVESIQEEIAERIERAAMQTKEDWEQLLLGSVEFVLAALDKSIVQILLLDGPSVLSWEEWKALDNKHSEFQLKDQLRQLQNTGKIIQLDLDLLSSFISGGLNELAIRLSTRESVDKAEVQKIIVHMFEGIRKDGN